jgi:hypothetical protein
METRDHLPHHSFYQPVMPDGQKSPSGTAPAPTLPRSGQGNRRGIVQGLGYQVVKDEIKRILVGVVRQLVNPKWWLYGLVEELSVGKYRIANDVHNVACPPCLHVVEQKISGR